MQRALSSLLMVNTETKQLPVFPQDDASLNAWAKRMHSFMSSNSPTGEGQNESCENDIDLECQEWLAGLAASTVGQKLLDHLNHMEASPHMRPSSAFEQACIFKRVFMYALTKNESPFGLPRRFPKYVVIANLSGERLMIHSSNPNLISLLTLGGSSPGCSYDGVEQILNKASTDESSSVVLYYALPFQMGTDSLYWECRIMKKNGLKYIDNELSCNSWDRQASKTNNTIDVECQHVQILEAQVDAFSANLNACDIDIKFEKIDGVDPSETVDAKQAKLLSLVTVLQNERRKMIEDHKHELEEQKKKCVKEVENNNEFMKATFEKQYTDESRMDREVKETKLEVNALRRALIEKDEEIKSLRSDALLKSEECEKETRSNEQRIKDLAKDNNSLKSQLKKLELEKSSALKKQEVVHQQMHDEAERKLQKAKQSEAVANQSFERMQTIERAFESVSNEKTAIYSELKYIKAKFTMQRVASLLQSKRIDTLKEMTRKARLDHVTCNEQLSEATRLNNSLDTCMRNVEDKLVNCNQTHKSKVDELQSHVDDLKAELEALTATTITTQTSNYYETSNSCIQTDILPETLQIGELEAECVKLRDDLAQAKIDLGRARAKNKRSPVPPNFLPIELHEPPTQPQAQQASQPFINNDSGNSVMTTPVHPQPSAAPHPTSQTTDTVLEGTIQQLHLALNVVTDLARQCKSHEQSARDAWNKVYTYEHMNCQQVQHAGTYNVNQFMYLPANHAHASGMNIPGSHY